MPYDSRIHHRRSIRLSGWDYSADGAYFVTVCTNRRLHMFGEIVDGQMGLNAVGSIVAEAWQWLATQYPFVALDEWCVMPNHLHGILVLTGRGGSRTAPTPHSPDDDTADAATVNGHATTTARKPVGRLIGAFKTVSTKHINQLRDMPAAVVGSEISGNVSSATMQKWIGFAPTSETMRSIGHRMDCMTR